MGPTAYGSPARSPTRPGPNLDNIAHRPTPDRPTPARMRGPPGAHRGRYGETRPRRMAGGPPNRPTPYGAGGSKRARGAARGIMENAVKASNRPPPTRPGAAAVPGSRIAHEPNHPTPPAWIRGRTDTPGAAWPHPHRPGPWAGPAGSPSPAHGPPPGGLYPGGRPPGGTYPGKNNRSRAMPGAPYSRGEGYKL